MVDLTVIDSDSPSGVGGTTSAPDNGGRDRLFATVGAAAADFRFDRRTAAVFDDMVGRSVPYYDEIQRMVAELAGDFAVPGSVLYDLGCSTGTTLIHLDRTVSPHVGFVGVDNSADMLDKARLKLAAAGFARECELKQGDLDHQRVVENASVVVMNLTLQFIRPLHRERALRWIYDGLREQGCLLLVEKQTLSASFLNRLFIQHYYDLKRRNGYSDVEIAQKREALENVLIPYRPEDNRALLQGIGFGHVEEFFRWYNFAGIVAVKMG